MYGLERTNRKLEEHFTKNCFNSSFPASLLCYMADHGLRIPYLIAVTDTEKLPKVDTDYLDGRELLGDPTTRGFAFETSFDGFESLLAQNPKVDLVVLNRSKHRHGLEIKLTVVPDSTTKSAIHEDQSAEIVIRPDSIVGLGASLVSSLAPFETEVNHIFGENLLEQLTFGDVGSLLTTSDRVVNAFNQILALAIGTQSPFLAQPIWRTDEDGALAEQCFDCFVWSNLGLSLLIRDLAESSLQSIRNRASLPRPYRSLAWLIEMVDSWRKTHAIEKGAVTNRPYGSAQTDKALSAPGSKTLKYLAGEELIRPRVNLGDMPSIFTSGVSLLAPERRLDAAIKFRGIPGI